MIIVWLGAFLSIGTLMKAFPILSMWVCFLFLIKKKTYIICTLRGLTCSQQTFTTNNQTTQQRHINEFYAFHDNSDVLN